MANKSSRRPPAALAAVRGDHASADPAERRPELVAAPAQVQTSVRSLVVLALVLAVSLVPRLATLQRVRMPSGEVVYRHFEGDERVFRELVQRVTRNVFDYSLHGSPLIGEFNPADYDLPIFFHPPAFVYTARVLSFLPLPLVPVLMNLATIALVFFLGRRLYDDERALWAAVITAVCPVLWFLSQKIWLDNMLVMMVAAAMAATVEAADRGRVAPYALAGATFGLAFLSKIAAVLIAPALVVLALQRDRRGIDAAKIAAFVLPALVMAGWWEVTLRLYNGVWSPSAFPNAGVAARVPFTADVLVRPWYFYLTNLVAITPIYLLGLGAVARRRRDELPVVLWVVAFFVGATVFGLRGGGYQSRYFAPAYPALALLAAEPIPTFRAGGLAAVLVLAGYGIVNGFIYAVNETPHVADFQFSAATIVIEKITLIGTFGQ